jgi:hypothetical protein
MNVRNVRSSHLGFLTPRKSTGSRYSTKGNEFSTRDKAQSREVCAHHETHTHKTKNERRPVVQILVLAPAYHTHKTSSLRITSFFLLSGGTKRYLIGQHDPTKVAQIDTL